MITYDPNHVAEAVALLPQQHQNSVSHIGLVTAFASEVQELEDMYQGLLVNRYLESSQGAMVDVYGAIAGVDRNGRDDVPYIAAIQAELLINRSSGEMPILYTVLGLLLPSSRIVRIMVYPPASFVVRVTGGPLSDTTVQSIVPVLRAATAGGVNGQFQWEPAGVDDSTAFTLDGLTAQDLDAGYLTGIG